MSASAYDPSTDWRTVVSPRLRVHYPVGSYETALEVARAGETALEELIEALGWVPETPIEIVLNDDTDSANGFAQNIPYALVGLNLAAPEEISDLSYYDDWLFDLVAHELAHIVHIDTVRGLPRLVNTLFGRWMVPNGVQPRWLVEGLATYFESSLTSAGRVRSPYFDMIMRMSVLDGVEMDLGEISGAPWRWPRSSAAYLYGGRFVDYIVRRFGEDVLRKISYDYGGRLIPFAVNAALERATGSRYPELYEDFLEELRDRYEAQRAEVERLGRREGEAITWRGEEVGRPRVAADGTIYFVESPLGEHTVLNALGSDGTTRSVGEVLSGAELALFPDGQRALVSQREIFGNYRSYGDLFSVDLESGEVTQETTGARAREPDISPDGKAVVFAQNEGLHSVIRIAPVDNFAAVETVADLGPLTQVWAPRFSPDGRSVVFVGFSHGRRDIYLVKIDQKEPKALMLDRATDGGPVFSRDGAWVIFHSDRDGIFNLYAVPSGGGQMRRLTRVVGGAFQPEPTPDGEAILYRTYGSAGFDLARLSIMPIAKHSQAEPARELPAPINHSRLEVYPARDYSAAATLLPRAWVPLWGADTRGGTLGASVFGQDAIASHIYGLQAWYGTTSNVPGFAASYANFQFHPGLIINLSRQLTFAPITYVRNRRPQAVEEEAWIGALAMRWPLWRRREENLTLSTSYELAYRHRIRALQIDPTDLTPRFPDDGRFSAVRLRLGFSNVRAYTSSISPEDGFRAELALRLEDPWVGSEHSAVSGTGSFAAYFENPWIDRQVFALSLFAGYGKSSYRRRRLYAIGGLARNDLVMDILSGRFGSPQALRGFPQRFFVGDAIATAHAEYRMPVVDLEAGVETLPIYFRTLQAALFSDIASVTDRVERLPRAAHFSVGAELRLSLLLGYALPVMTRIGYGRGLGRDRVQNVYIVMGNSF